MWNYSAKVIRCIDADTIECVVDLGFFISIKEKFRLIGINAPELSGIERDLGLKAKEYLKSLIEGQEVTLDTVKSKDKYGRWLAVVYFNGVNMNQDLIDKGFAKRY